MNKWMKEWWIKELTNERKNKWKGWMEEWMGDDWIKWMNKMIKINECTREAAMSQ